MTAKPFSISYTKLSTFRRCLLKYDRQYIRGFYPKPTMGQTRGTAGHAALANWHRNYNPEAAIKTAWDAWYGEGFINGKDWQLLEDSLNRYFAYSNEHADTFQIIESEQKFQIEYTINLGDEASGDILVPVVFTGFIDGIVKEKDRIWLLENKFYKRLDQSGLDMDSQVSLYLLAAYLLKYEAEGVIYNMVRVADGKTAIEEPVVRKRMYRNQQGFQAIQDEMLIQAEQMLRYHQEGGKPYRNATKDCSWDCSFYSACLSLLDNGIEDEQILENVSRTRRTDE